MAMAGRMRSTLPLIRKLTASDSLLSQRSTAERALLYCPSLNSEMDVRLNLFDLCLQRGYSTAPANTGDKVKVPVSMFGGSGNYASALYLAAVKANALDNVEAELFGLVEASKKSPTFSQFTKDLSVPSDTRMKAINDICSQAKFSDVTKNFLVVLAENGRLRHIESIAKRFSELTMAHKGELKATVTTVIPLPPDEEKDLKETLQEIMGQGTKVKLEQKIDPSILGGLVVEFGQKVFDMSIKTRARQMERFLREPLNFDSL